jgi:hypothetical protein
MIHIKNFVVINEAVQAIWLILVSIDNAFYTGSDVNQPCIRLAGDIDAGK